MNATLQPKASPPIQTPLSAPDAPRVERGSLWQLGEHRLLCGDCTDEENIKQLMEGEEADMAFLDPPYGVGYGASAKRPFRARRAIAGDSLGELGTYDLLHRAILSAPLRAGGAFYVCAAAGPNELLFRLALRDAGWQVRQSLVWCKQHFTLSRQDYQWKHETLLYGWLNGENRCWNGGRKQTTVWEYARALRNTLHPTQKPLALVERAVLNSSNVGDIVYDGFGGSGTTLMACEATRRKCRMMEIEPSYCELILQRWKAVSGEKTEKLAREVA
jgi:DNA modification methylase